MIKIDEKSASGVRKYLYEYVVIILVIAVVTLFGLYINLSNYIRDELTEMIIKTVTTIETNNNYLKLQK